MKYRVENTETNQLCMFRGSGKTNWDFFIAVIQRLTIKTDHKY